MASYIVEEKVSEDKESLKPSKKSLIKGFNLKKFGGVKTLIMILVLLVVAVMLYNFSGFNLVNNSQESGEIGYTTSLEYIDKIESKLMEVVGGIKGAGKVKVMISINSSPELEVANNMEEKTVTTSSGTTSTITNEPIIVQKNGEETPLILKETLPSINGVIVVSSGASDVKVRLDIINAVSTVLNIDLNKIEVFVGN